MIAIVVAAAKNGAIGKDNRLLWHLPDDLKFFKRVTTGHPVLMGRNTYEAIGKPLPNRRNIIITRRNDFSAEGCEIAHSIEDALQLVDGDEEIMIVGGADIYQQILPETDRVYLTIVDAEPEADRYFPELMPDEWTLVDDIPHEKDEKHAYSFRIQTWDRK